MRLLNRRGGPVPRPPLSRRPAAQEGKQPIGPYVGIAALLAAALLLTACARSATELEHAVQDKSGVMQVDVEENDGDNDIPFATAPKYVTIHMESDASVEEVMAVFDAYDDSIDDGDVFGVEVILAGPKHATLGSGEDIHVAREMAADLVRAQVDDAVIEYRREAYPVLPSVELRLASTGFSQVVAAADRYRDVPDLEDVEVASGRFALVRDEGNEDQRVTAARERLTSLVDSRFALLGAVVSGRGPLELLVDPSDLNAVRQFVEQSPAAATVTNVVVRVTQ